MATLGNIDLATILQAVGDFAGAMSNANDPRGISTGEFVMKQQQNRLMQAMAKKKQDEEDARKAALQELLTMRAPTMPDTPQYGPRVEGPPGAGMIATDPALQNAPRDNSMYDPAEMQQRDVDLAQARERYAQRKSELLGLAAPDLALANMYKDEQPIPISAGGSIYDRRSGKIVATAPTKSDVPSSLSEAIFATGGNVDQARQMVANKFRDPNQMTPWQQAMAERQAATEDARNRPQVTPYVNRTTGNPVKLDPVTQTYKDGSLAITPAELINADTFDKEVTNARKIVANVDRTKSLQNLIDSNPSAFDAKKVNESRIKSNVPFYGEQMANAVFTPDELKVRATVARDAAAIINELYGAALSTGEQERAKTFTPDPKDTLEMMRPKLEAALAWAQTQEKSIIPGAITRAKDQLGIKDQPQQASPQSGVARPTTDEEFNRLPTGTKYIDPDDGKIYRKP